MERNLINSSMTTLASVIMPILETIKAQSICNIGTELNHSKSLYEWLKPRQGKLFSIDPAPREDFLNWLGNAKDVLKHFSKVSLDAIADVGPVDAWFIDGDHNWYTVYNELTVIDELHKNNKRPLLALFHSISWPTARRDSYYNPEKIPVEFRHSYSWQLGVTIDSQQLVPGGFRGEGKFAYALHHGGPHNGVLTAVEDYVQQHPDRFFWSYIPAFFGLGVLFDRAHPQAKELAHLLAPYHDNPLLALLEVNRLTNYMAVLELHEKYKKEKV